MTLDDAGKVGVCFNLIVYEADTSELVLELRVTTIEVKVDAVAICTVIPELSCSMPDPSLLLVLMVKVETTAVLGGLVKSEEICSDILVADGSDVEEIGLVKLT